MKGPTEYEKRMKKEKRKEVESKGRNTIIILCLILTIIGFTIYNSVVTINPYEIGVVSKLYGKPQAPGRIISTTGEKGIQADILKPGFHFRFLIKILNDIHYINRIRIPHGHVGVLTSKDGIPLRRDQEMADPWNPDEETKMLDTRYFLTHGGQKGIQTTTLRAGDYHINTMLFEITIVNTEKQTWEFKY